jgi:hypothetical protein
MLSQRDLDMTRHRENRGRCPAWITCVKNTRATRSTYIVSRDSFPGCAISHRRRPFSDNSPKMEGTKHRSLGTRRINVLLARSGKFLERWQIQYTMNLMGNSWGRLTASENIWYMWTNVRSLSDHRYAYNKQLVLLSITTPCHCGEGMKAFQ